jgi:hypothetical protein
LGQEGVREDESEHLGFLSLHFCGVWDRQHLPILSLVRFGSVQSLGFARSMHASEYGVLCLGCVAFWLLFDNPCGWLHMRRASRSRRPRGRTWTRMSGTWLVWLRRGCAGYS